MNSRQPARPGLTIQCPVARSGATRMRVFACTAVTWAVTLAAGQACAQFFEPPLGYDRRPGYDRPYGYEPGPNSPYNRPPPTFRGNARPLPPTLIVERLEDGDYEDIGQPRYDGAVYAVDATSPRGMRMRIVFDAFTGAVLDRVALGRGGEDGFAGPRRPSVEPRGWFGNNLRPPEMGERRFGNRSEDPEEDTFESLARPDLSPRLAPPGRVETGPSIAPPAARSPENGQSRSAAIPRDSQGNPPRDPGPNGRIERSDPAGVAARADPAGSGATAEPAIRATPRIELAPRTDPGSRVEGLNPASGPAARPSGARPNRNERAAIPENNRQGGPLSSDDTRMDPAARPRTTRPAVPAGAASAATPAVTAQSAPAPRVDGSATDGAEPPRPDRPVRVIGGVTPMNPNANPSAQAEPKP